MPLEILFLDHVCIQKVVYRLINASVVSQYVFFFSFHLVQKHTAYALTILWPAQTDLGLHHIFLELALFT